MNNLRAMRERGGRNVRAPGPTARKRLGDRDVPDGRANRLVGLWSSGQKPNHGAGAAGSGIGPGNGSGNGGMIAILSLLGSDSGMNSRQHQLSAGLLT